MRLAHSGFYQPLSVAILFLGIFLLASYGFVSLTIPSIFANLISDLSLTFATEYFVATGLASEIASTYASAPMMCGVLTAPIVGWLLDKMGRDCQVMLIGQSACSISNASKY